MNELPPDAVVTVDGAGISSGDAVPDGADAAELFDIEMDDAAGIRHDSESRKSVNRTGGSTGGWFAAIVGQILSDAKNDFSGCADQRLDVAGIEGQSPFEKAARQCQVLGRRSHVELRLSLKVKVHRIWVKRSPIRPDVLATTDCLPRWACFFCEGRCGHRSKWYAEYEALKSKRDALDVPPGVVFQRSRRRLI
jgi:hypothetical protein